LTENNVYLKSKRRKWRFFLGIWTDIEPEEEAIERVSKENWRNYLRAPMVFGEKDYSRKIKNYGSNSWCHCFCWHMSFGPD